MISLVRAFNRTLLIQQLEDRKLKHQPSVEAPQVQALLIRQAHQVTSQALQLREQVILAKLRPEAQPAIRQDLHNIQALKDLTQVLELQFLLCHHPTNLLKGSHPSLTHLIQQERHKRQLENIYHHEEVK